MRKVFFVVANMLALLTVGTAAFAQSSADPQVLSSIMWGAGLSIALAAAGCGIGQGLALKGACEGIARNPEAGGKIQTMALIGLALIESLGIYAFVISLLLLFVNPHV